jgi:hypothetical protein
MDNLKSNLYSIAILATQVKLSVYTLEKVIENKDYLDEIEFSDNFLKKIKFPNLLRAILANQSIIQFCSFLDEYDKFNTKQIGLEYSQKIQKVRSKNYYAINRIKKWQNLFEFRNQIAAHNFDIKKGRSKESILKNNTKKVYNIPDTIDEKILFYKLIQKMCNNIFAEFSDVAESFDFDFNLNSKINILNNKINLEKELNLIQENM